MANSGLDNRLRRAEGQLHKLRTEISAGADCTEVVPQFLAVRGALSAAFETYVKDSLQQCATADEEKMKQLIKLLAKL